MSFWDSRLPALSARSLLRSTLAGASRMTGAYSCLPLADEAWPYAPRFPPILPSQIFANFAMHFAGSGRGITQRGLRPLSLATDFPTSRCWHTTQLSLSSSSGIHSLKPVSSSNFHSTAKRHEHIWQRGPGLGEPSP